MLQKLLINSIKYATAPKYPFYRPYKVIVREKLRGKLKEQRKERIVLLKRRFMKTAHMKQRKNAINIDKNECADTIF